MEAIILAGGLGTRLRSVVSGLPKPMAPVNGKPFLVYILDWLKKNNVRKIILSVGYKWELIEAYFGNHFNGMDILYSVENSPLGTGGAIKKALSLCEAKNVVIVNGDTFFDIDISKLTIKVDSKITLSLKPLENFDRYGCVAIDKNGFVLSFEEKQFYPQGYINGGVYLLDRDIFNGVTVLKESFSFEAFIQKYFHALKASAKIFDNYFIDIGIPDDFQKAQEDFQRL